MRVIYSQYEDTMYVLHNKSKIRSILQAKNRIKNEFQTVQSTLYS